MIRLNPLWGSSLILPRTDVVYLLDLLLVFVLFWEDCSAQTETRKLIAWVDQFPSQKNLKVRAKNRSA